MDRCPHNFGQDCSLQIITIISSIMDKQNIISISFLGVKRNYSQFLMLKITKITKTHFFGVSRVPPGVTANERPPRSLLSILSMK